MKFLRKVSLVLVMIFSLSLFAVSCTGSQIISSETETDAQAKELETIEYDNTYSINKDEVEDPNDRGN